MPIARYFIFVGGALATLLLIAGWFLPTPPAMFANQLVIPRSVIRIKSAHKWPEKVVLDTSQLIITPAVVEERPAAQSIRLPPEEAGDQLNLEASARLNPDTPSSAAVDGPTMRIKRGLARTARSKHVAKPPVTRRLARAEAGGGCCQFGWIDNGQTRSGAISRGHIASWPMNWPATTGGIER